MSNDFIPYADDDAANVVTQAEYLAAPWRPGGFVPGIAESARANKVWRQTSFVTSQLAQFIADTIGIDVLDDGDTAAFLANLKAAIGVAARPARIVTSSANFLIAATDYAVGLNRTAAVAVTQATLPAAAIGQEFVVDDLVGNFDAFPVTIVPPAGTIAGLANFVLNERRQSAMFRYYGTNIWSVRT